MITIWNFLGVFIVFPSICILLYKAYIFRKTLLKEQEVRPISHTSFALAAQDMHTSTEDLSLMTDAEEPIEAAPDTIRDSEPMLVTPQDLEPPLVVFEDPNARPILHVYDYPAGEILVPHTRGGFFLLQGEISRSHPDGSHKTLVAKVDPEDTMFTAAFFTLEPEYVYRVTAKSRMCRLSFAQFGELLFAFSLIGSYKIRKTLFGQSVRGHNMLSSAFKTEAHHSKIVHQAFTEEYKTIPAPPSESALRESAGIILPKTKPVCVFPDTTHRPSTMWQHSDADWSKVSSEIDDALRRALNEHDSAETQEDTTDDGPLTVRGVHMPEPDYSIN